MKIKIIFFIKLKNVAKISAIIETVAKKRKYKDRNQKRSFFFFVAFTGQWSDKKKSRDNVHRQYFFSLGPIVEIAVLKLYQKMYQ